ncbi:hypothetical protein OWR28_22550 [Chryseobacterium sp. 1B4]
MLFLTTVSYGQTTRFVYETLVNPDSINLVSMKSERTFLDIKEGQSLFISENKLKRDSLVASIRSEAKETQRKEEKDFSKMEGRKHFEPTFLNILLPKLFRNRKCITMKRLPGNKFTIRKTDLYNGK